MFQIRAEAPGDGAAIEALLDESFGIRRHTKISYRYRIGRPPVETLSLVALKGSTLVGSIRYWTLRLDEQPALLLGPLAIAPHLRGVGIGRALVRESLGRAADLGHRLVFLVGDPAYYCRFGFTPAPAGIVMPGEDPARLQWLGLAGAAAPEAGGLLLRDGEESPAGADEGAARPDLARQAWSPGDLGPSLGGPRPGARSARPGIGLIRHALDAGAQGILA